MGYIEWKEAHGGLTPGGRVMYQLFKRLYEYGLLTGHAPTRIKLGHNKLMDYREEARLTTRFDVISENSFHGVRIIPARHPDDMIIDAGEGDE